MLFRHKQAMTRKDGPMIEKGDTVVIFKDDASDEFAAHDFAEQADLMRFFRHGDKIALESPEKFLLIDLLHR